MKKYILRFGIALFTFGVGVVLVSTWFINFFLYKLISVDEVKTDSIQVQQTKENQELSFSHTGPIACGMDSFGNGASSTSYTASDGTIISVTSISLKSERAARKRFQQSIKHATNIIELSPNLDYWKRKIGEKAFIESDGKVFIIEYFKVSSENNKSFSMTIIGAASLRHAIAFDKEQESFARSLMINRLKP